MPVEVDYDPFSQTNAAPQGGVPVTHDPFATDGSPLKDAAKAVGGFIDRTGTGLYRGLADLIGAPRDMADMVKERYADSPSIQFAPKTKPMLPGSGAVKEYMFNDMGIPEVKAETMPGRIWQGAAEGVGAAAPMLMGNPAPLLTSAYAASSGAGAQGARELNIDPEQHPTLARLAPILGAVAAPLALAGGRVAFPSMPGLVKDALKSAPKIETAADIQAMGNRIGVPVTGPEALGDPTLLRIQQLAEQSPKGAPLRSIMAERPEAQRQAAMQTANELAPGVTPKQAAQSIKAAAQGSIDNLTSARTAAVNPHYEAAALEKIPTRSLDGFVDELHDALDRVGTDSKIGKELMAYGNQVLGTFDNGAASVGQLDTIYKEIRSRAMKGKFEPDALDAEVKGVLRPLNRKLGDLLSANNENIAYGRSIYKEMSPPVDALRKSSIGEVAKAKNPELSQQVSQLLSSDKARPTEVYAAMRDLMKADKESVPKLIGAHIDATMDKASKALANGSVENAGGRFYTDIAGTPYAKANLRAAFNALPQGTDRWGAFENTLKVFEANARRLPVGSPTFEKGALGSELAGGTIAQPMQTFNDWVGRLRYGRNLGNLAELFARTDSVDEMRRIAGLKPGDPKARIAIGTLLNANAAAVPAGSKP